MKQPFRKLLFSVIAVIMGLAASGQCSICTKTASQMGEEAGKGLNGGILYLAAAPFLILSYIGYRWWKDNRN